MISFVFEGEPIPCPRPQVRPWGIVYPERYKTFKKQLAAELKAQYIGFEPLACPLELKAVFYRSNKRNVDLDNLIKALLDAVQDTGLIANDSLIGRIEAEKLIDKENPRVQFEINEWKED